MGPQGEMGPQGDPGVGPSISARLLTNGATVLGTGGIEPIIFTLEQFNTVGESLHPGATPSRIVATDSGRYLLTGRARVSDTNYSRLYIIRNGAEFIAIAEDPYGNGFQTGSVVLDLTQGDYVELGVQSYQGVRDVEAQFEAVLLVNGPAGPQGPQGETGPQGPQGDIGPEGPMGPQGEEGPQGSPGGLGPMGPAGPAGPAGPQGPQGEPGPAYSAGDGLQLTGTAFSIPTDGITSSMIGVNQVTSAQIANRIRTFSIPGTVFAGHTTSTSFAWGTPQAVGITVRSFAGSPNGSGGINVVFTVPDDYVGPSTADLAACPGLQTPRLRIRWVTNSVQSPGLRKINVDVSFSQIEYLTSQNGNRFRYNFTNGSMGPSSSESLDPTANEVALQVIPEPGDEWDSPFDAPVMPWQPGQIVALTLFRNSPSTDPTAIDPNSQLAGILSVSFDYEADR